MKKFCLFSPYQNYGVIIITKKALRVMRLSAFLLFAICLQVSASGNAQNISISQRNTSLEKVFKEIHKKTGYQFFYQSELLREAKKFDIDVKNASVKRVLDICFMDQPLTFSIAEKAIIVKRKESVNFIDAPQLGLIEVRGKVKDEKGDPIAGVTVSIEGGKGGVSTDSGGNFSITVSDNAILIFSSVGYKTITVSLKGRTSIEVTMHAEVSALNDVVVVGYGTQKKINLTGAVSVVDSKYLENRPVVNVTHSLQGLVPGLNVNVGYNTKPGQSFDLNVRGMGNLNGNDQPYVLIDGLEMSLADVNPNDIESISVLKDASVSAIYGSRAAFGVILITTKKGSAGRTTFSFSSTVGITTQLKLPEMVNSLEFANFFNSGTFNAIGTREYSDAKLKLLEQYIQDPTGMSIFPEVNSNTYTNWENSSNGVANTNWVSLHYKPFALNKNHNLSMSGGNKVTQYFVSGGYYNEGGNMRYAKLNYDRYNLNASVTSQILSWAKIKANTKYSQSKYETPFPPDFEGSFFHNIFRMRPNASPYDLNGKFNEQSFIPYLQSGAYANEDGTNVALLTGIEFEPVKKWKFSIDLNLRDYNSEQTYLKLPGTLYGIDGTPFPALRSGFRIPAKGGYGRNMINSAYVSTNVYTSYGISLNDKHNFDIILGFQQESNENKSLLAESQDLISSSRPGISLVTGSKTISESRTHWATRGSFGRLTYNYKSKFLFELNGRYDGSSRFASDSRWGFFPSVSAGYNLDQEKFFKEKVNWVDKLKVRASYGFLGNQSGAGLYSYSENMGITVPGIGTGGGWYFANGREAYLTVPGAFNPNITWEKIGSVNLGVDFAVFNNRLIGSVDIYQRNTRDMLGPSLDIPDMYGGSPPRTNNADLRTRGWELSLNWRGRISDQVSYSLGGLLADNNSVITKYQNPSKNDPSGSWYVGKQAGEIWGYRTSGLVQNAEQANAFNSIDHSFLSAQAWKPGDVIYQDLNGDGKINKGANQLGDMGDLTIIGNSSARYLYSINGSVTWKRLSMSMLWQGVGKRDFSPEWNDAYFWGAGSDAQVIVFKQHLDYWTPENPGAYYPNPYITAAGSIQSYMNKTTQPSDRYLQDASYLRLKNLTINYNLPVDKIYKAKINKFNVFFSGENLLTITNLAKMFDPETLVSGATPNEGKAKTGKIYPLSKVYSFGLNLNF